MSSEAPSTLTAAYLHAIYERERRHDHPDTLQQFAIAYQRLVQASQNADPTTHSHILRQLVDGFEHAESNFAFGTIATMCGIVVEQGGNPRIALEPILDRLVIQLARVREYVDIMEQHLGIESPIRVAPADWPAIGRKHPDDAWVIGEWFAITFVAGAAVTMLCRDVAARIQARQRIDLVQRTESARSEHAHGYYVAELLGMIDEEQVLVLDTTRNVGHRIHLTGVRNNFHLFSLLQDALLAGDPRLNSLAVSIAKSERMLPSVAAEEWSTFGDQDVALWSFNTWMAMKADGVVQTFVESEQQPRWIWGEMKPTEIPMLDGERIILLAPLDYPRSWEIANFIPLHSAMQSSVHIKATLSRAEYDEWIAKLRAMAEK